MKHIVTFLLIIFFSKGLFASNYETEMLLLIKIPNENRIYDTLKQVFEDNFKDEDYRVIAKNFQVSESAYYTPGKFATKVNEYINRLLNKPVQYDILHYATFGYKKKVEVLRGLIDHESVDELIFEGICKNFLTRTWSVG